MGQNLHKTMRITAVVKFNMISCFIIFFIRISPLHPEISIHISHTVPYTFFRVLKRKMFLTIKSFFI